MVIAGVMSGSSLDGLDIAIVRFGENNDWELLWNYDMAYSTEWVNRLKDYHTLSAAKYISLKYEYSQYIGQCLIKAFGHYLGKIDFVSFHGHTLIHLPAQGITEQIGNGGVLTAITKIPTITDFRIQDVTKGGVGTPIAPLADLHLFHGHDYYLNLGGIANITILKDSAIKSAYDICPCNQVLNFYSNRAGKEFDEGGNMARQGSFLPELSKYLDSIPYFRLNAPKSLDNNWIKNEFIPNFPSGGIEDILHTFTRWMAICIGNELENSQNPTSLMVSGGGAHNTFFMECLREELEKKSCSLSIPSKEIIDYKEAILMALMARNYLSSEVNVLSSVTGASSDSIGGAMYKN